MSGGAAGAGTDAAGVLTGAEAPAAGGGARGCARADALHPTVPTASARIVGARTGQVPLPTRQTLGGTAGVTDSHA